MCSSPGRSVPCPRRRAGSPRPPFRASRCCCFATSSARSTATTDFADLFPSSAGRASALAAGAGHPAAVPRGARRPAGRRRRPRPHRLEIPARPRARPTPASTPPCCASSAPAWWTAAPDGSCGRMLETCQARGLVKARGSSAPIDPRPGRHPHAQPPRAGRRDPCVRAEQPGHRGAGLAARGPAGVVRPLRPRVEDAHLPRSAAGTRGLHARTCAARTATPCSTGSTSPPRPRSCGSLKKVLVLRQVSARRLPCARAGRPRVAARGSGPRTSHPQPETSAGQSRPTDTQARFRTSSGTSWTGYIVHLTRELATTTSDHLMSTHADDQAPPCMRPRANLQFTRPWPGWACCCRPQASGRRRLRRRRPQAV